MICVLQYVECQGWKATKHCSPYSERDPSGDLDCSTPVPSSISGYCLCEDGKRTGFSDCRHSPFSCSSLCQQLPQRFCDVYDATLRSSAAFGCSNNIRLTNTLQEEVLVHQINERGHDVFVMSIPSGLTYNVCLPLTQPHFLLSFTNRFVIFVFLMHSVCTQLRMTAYFCKHPSLQAARPISPFKIVISLQRELLLSRTTA